MVLFDQNGKLRSIDFFADFKDGFSGGANQDNLTNQSHFGFYRDYSKQAPSPFGTVFWIKKVIRNFPILKPQGNGHCFHIPYL
jgi:hypothetical protein